MHATLRSPTGEAVGTVPLDTMAVRYATTLQLLVDSKSQIARLRENCDQLGELVQEQRRVLAKQDATIAELRALVEAQTETITGLLRTVSERDKIIIAHAGAEHLPAGSMVRV